MESGKNCRIKKSSITYLEMKENSVIEEEEYDDYEYLPWLEQKELKK